MSPLIGLLPFELTRRYQRDIVDCCNSMRDQVRHYKGLTDDGAQTSDQSRNMTSRTFHRIQLVQFEHTMVNVRDTAFDCHSTNSVADRRDMRFLLLPVAGPRGCEVGVVNARGRGAIVNYSKSGERSREE